jgi:hypothetical protein
VLTGNPHTTVQDLMREQAAAQDLKNLTDYELLRSAWREVAIVLILVARALKGLTAAQLVTRAEELSSWLGSFNAASGPLVGHLPKSRKCSHLPKDPTRKEAAGSRRCSDQKLKQSTIHQLGNMTIAPT